MEDYTKQILRVVVAQICQTIGWHTIQSTPLELLVDILHKYLQEASRQTNRYTELYGRTAANLDDVGLAFRDLGINLPDMLDYVNNVDSVPCAVDVPEYPVRKASSLNFLKPGSKEVITRPVHIHEHLPPICPENEEPSTLADTTISNFGSDMVPVMTDITNVDAANSASLSPTLAGKAIFKRPDFADLQSLKKSTRMPHEDEGRPTREISSVMMTSSGFISPAREGKLPDAKTPIIPELNQKLLSPPNSAVPANAPPPPTPAMPIAAMESKFEKKSSKKQKSIGILNSLEAREQRKRDRQLAKLQKRRADMLSTGTGSLPKIPKLPKVPKIPKMPRKSGGAGKRQKLRDSKLKHESITERIASEHLPVAGIENLPSVSLPADLTIKSETIPIRTPYSDTATISSLIGSIPSELEVKPTLGGNQVKLSSEPDKQKYSIFKKISKKSRDDNYHHYNNLRGARISDSPTNNSPHNLYSGLPSLPESTTIRPIHSTKSDPGDSNVIVVDDDSPSPQPGPSSATNLLAPPVGTHILPIPQLPAGTTATVHPRGFHAPASMPFNRLGFMEDSRPNVTIEQQTPAVGPVRKQQRKPRKNKQRVLSEQSAPLNLSNERATNAYKAVKTPRKAKTRPVGRPSKRLEALNTPSMIDSFSDTAALSNPSTSMGISSGNLDRSNHPLNIFKDNQFLSGMQRYPLLYPFPLLSGPGLIPNANFMHSVANPLMHFRSPFGYNDFVGGIRPPIRPLKVDTSSAITPPPTIPLDLDSSNVYCNVPPLVPDSLKYQLSPALMSKSKYSSGIGGSGAPGSSKSTFSKTIFNPFTSSSKSPKMLDAPIEISDDEKVKSDNEVDGAARKMPESVARSPSETASTSGLLPMAASHRTESDDRMIIDEECGGAVSSDHCDGRSLDGLSSLGTDDAITAVPSSGKSEKKRDKEHKKGKRDKDGKIKKKKDKKDKSKSKEKAEKRKEEKKDRQKKQKKEKRKEKLRSNSHNNTDVKSTDVSQHDQAASSLSSIPKLTLRLGSPRSTATGDDSSDTRKKSHNDDDASAVTEDVSHNVALEMRRESTPELARISPLVTRPPKQKISSKDKTNDSESQAGKSTQGNASVAATVVSAPVTAPISRGPGRPPKNPNSSIAAAAATSSTLESCANAGATTSSADCENGKPVNQTATTATSSSSKKQPNEMSRKGNNESSSTGSSTTAKKVATEIDSTDAEGNQVWICPACGRVDDGTPMIGCDGCDAWYHWVCVGIQVPPDEREDWYCRVCIAKKQEANGADKKKKRKKKNKAT